MKLRHFFDSLTPGQIEDANRIQLQENSLVYNEFKIAHINGMCSLCNESLNKFVSYKPCFHWFLRPNGIKKKHFNKYLSTPIGYFRFECYLRWMANLDKPLRNINDLKSEMSQGKEIEYTIKYKNIEWSVSIGKSDRLGHINSQNAYFPHFHIQMIHNHQPFIRFNDYHIPLSDEDIFMFQVIEEASDKIDLRRDLYGQGMSIIEDKEMLEKLDRLMTRTDNAEKGTFDITTIFKMPEGETIDVMLLNNIEKESKESGIPIRHLLNQKFPMASILTEIRPGKGVPEISKRSTRN